MCGIDQREQWDVYAKGRKFAGKFLAGHVVGLDCLGLWPGTFFQFFFKRHKIITFC